MAVQAIEVGQFCQRRPRGSSWQIHLAEIPCEKRGGVLIEQNIFMSDY
jgi:hypothetical protein